MSDNQKASIAQANSKIEQSAMGAAFKEAQAANAAAVEDGGVLPLGPKIAQTPSDVAEEVRTMLREQFAGATAKMRKATEDLDSARVGADLQAKLFAETFAANNERLTAMAAELEKIKAAAQHEEPSTLATVGKWIFRAAVTVTAVGMTANAVAYGLNRFRSLDEHSVVGDPSSDNYA